MASGQFRITILNPTEEISALKLRGWLQSEAEQIDAMTGDDDLVIIRLFLMERVRYGLTQKKLDSILQGITDKFPSIYRVELFLVKQPLTMAQMQEEAAQANAELEEMATRAAAFAESANLYPEEEGLIQFFGYSTEAAKDESPFDLPEDGLVCMVSNITEYNRAPINKQTGRAFELDQWFVSEGAHEETIVHGPFVDEGAAMTFAREHCKAIRFKTAPVFESI